MTDTSILQPHLTHQFTLRISGTDEDIRDTFAKQVLNIKLDYLNKAVSLVIEQPRVGGALHQFLYEWIHSLGYFEIVAGNPDQPDYIIKLLGIECTKHRFELGYERCEASCHHLRFSFQNLAMGDVE